MEVHPRQNILHIVRKAIQKGTEVLVDVFGVSLQSLESKGADIIELIAGCSTKETILHGKVLHFLVLVQHRLMGRQQAVVKTLDDRHRQDDKSVFVGLERAKEGVCHVPNEVCFFLYILSGRRNTFVAGRHALHPFK